VIRVCREFKCCAGNCNCLAGYRPCAMEVTVEAPVGEVIGYVRQRSVYGQLLCLLSDTVCLSVLWYCWLGRKTLLNPIQSVCCLSLACQYLDLCSGSFSLSVGRRLSVNKPWASAVHSSTLNQSQLMMMITVTSSVHC